MQAFLARGGDQLRQKRRRELCGCKKHTLPPLDLLWDDNVGRRIVTERHFERITEENGMFKKSILLGILALAFVTLAAGEVLAWGIQFGGYGCLSGGCSYEGDITIVGAKGQSVDAGTLLGMLQTVSERHLVGF